MKKKNNITEIDFYKVSMLFWNEKFKILLISALAVILMLIFMLINPTKYQAITEIKPISTFEENKYLAFNELVNDNKKFFKINRNLLNNLFVEILDDGEIFKDAIKKFELIKPQSAKSDNKYTQDQIMILNNNVNKLASTLELLPPIEKSGAERYIGDGKSKSYWTISFKIYDKNTWENLLAYLNQEINKEIKNYLNKLFQNKIKIEKQMKSFRIEDIDNLILNKKIDYKRIISDKLVFLKEQAAIARQLEIAKNTIEAQNFTNSNIIVSNLGIDKSYYMRGYEMIEKEIELIESRKNQNAFIPDLLSLEQEKRSIEEDMFIKRLEFLFSKTPIKNSDNFIGSLLTYEKTIYKNFRPLIPILIITALFGGLIGIFYVLIINKEK